MTNHALVPTKATIIIAAYNESTVIRETLQELCDRDGLNTYQIVVVCNGCADDTEQIVRNEFPSVHCQSLPQASKALAIRHAESLNPGFPRLYLDADIVLSAKSATNIMSIAHEQESPALVIPSSRVITDKSSTFVRSFYRTWYKTSYVQKSGYGAGAYAVNKSGRDRFGLWPELVADDAFVRSQFGASETHIVRSIKVAVRAPKTLWSLIKIKTRSKFGNLELDAYLKQLPVDKRKHNIGNKLTANPHTVGPEKWYDSAVYLSINVTALCLANWFFVIGKKTWHRDNSNRL